MIKIEVKPQVNSLNDAYDFGTTLVEWLVSNGLYPGKDFNLYNFINGELLLDFEENTHVVSLFMLKWGNISEIFQ